MNSKRFLIQFQYLGFRYHGVQAQAQLPSIQERIYKTLLKTFKGDSFSLRFSSRTDSLVSAEESYFLLMFKAANTKSSVEITLNSLPPDIQVGQVEAVEDDFIMMKQVDKKEYHYFFAHNITNAHPFAAPFITSLKEPLNIPLMNEAAKLFEGEHNFANFCFKPKANAEFIRTISSCEIEVNTRITASFFPANSYVLKVSAKGFLRGQVRLMCGALFRIGLGQLTLEELKVALSFPNQQFVKWMAPSAGLILHKTHLRIDRH